MLEKKTLFIIFIVIISICITVLLVLCCLKSYENYIIRNGMIFLNLTSSQKKKIASTPLEELKSRMFLNDQTTNTPAFFCYNFHILSPVQNQGSSCGSCWAFVTTGLISDRVSINTNRFLILSAQQLLQCYDYPYGCEGASPEKVFQWMEKKKIKLQTNEQIRYLQFNTNKIPNKCSYKLEGISVKANYVYRIVDFIEEKNINLSILSKNIKNMKRELIKNGPFFATIRVYDNFFSFVENAPYNASSGYYVGGHAIIIVGYSDPGQDPRKGYKGGYWICRNSWGTGWPKGNPIYPGYFTVAMGKNICGIESRCGAVEPDVIRSKNNSNIIFDRFSQFASKFLK